MQPTDEQLRAIALFRAGSSMVIEAGAGTGKTETLRMLAESTKARGQYMAFNRAIVVEAQRRMPDTVTSQTAHSLAFRAIGNKFKHRLNSPRMRSTELAERLKLTPFTVDIADVGTRELHEAYLAGLVMRSIATFCNSADDEPGREHVAYIDGIDMPAEGGKRTYENNNDVRRHVLPAMKRAWDDMRDPKGQMPYRHDHYLKAWQLSGPKIAADFILFDEAQDASPVMDAIVAAQTHAQVVLVGDANQAIYGWRGAVNAIAQARERLPVSMLTQSFRFGPAIADVANLALVRLNAELRLRGTDSIASRVEFLPRPGAVLCRTNAIAVATVLRAKTEGRRVHLLGGGQEVSAFARAAGELQIGRHTMHPELACFDDWSSVQRYVADDPQGSELRLMVKLVDEFGVPVIIQALERMPAEAAADLVVSTAHKAKGREWPRVQIASDFAVEDAGEDEWRLAYVAVTRARDVLDPGPIGQALALNQPVLEVQETDAEGKGDAPPDPEAVGWAKKWQDTYDRARTDRPAVTKGGTR